jgi:hypothetical protein
MTDLTDFIDSIASHDATDRNNALTSALNIMSVRLQTTITDDASMDKNQLVVGMLTVKILRHRSMVAKARSQGNIPPDANFNEWVDEIMQSLEFADDKESSVIVNSTGVETNFPSQTMYRQPNE